jgi:hypothetical protein
MHHPSAEEFLLALLETLKDLPPEFARRLAEIQKRRDTDRAEAIRRLFREFASD